jgi:hypothetical protein
MPSSLDHLRSGDGEPNFQAETMAESLGYGFLKKYFDRRNARRDARSGLPAYSKEPVPTPTVEKLFAEFVTLVAAERERWNREAASLRREAAKLTANIKDLGNDADRAQNRLDSGQTTTTNEVGDNDLATWRLRAAFRAEWKALEDTRRRLASAQARLEQCNADISSRYNQHLDRQNQIVGHVWLRITTYRTELIRAHPHGDRLSVVLKWGPAELAHALERSRKLEEQLIKPREAIEPPEKD